MALLIPPSRCVAIGETVREPTRPAPLLDRLQGNDIETLRLADEIHHLEYLLTNDFLREVTLVNTPGTGALVDEHQSRTKEYILRKALCERHHKETNAIGDSADAIVFIVGAVAGQTDKEFLDHFSEATSGRARALNAIGVMSKVNLSPDVLARRLDLAGKIAKQLQDYLNTVVPVSAGLRRILDRLVATGCPSFSRRSGEFRRRAWRSSFPATSFTLS